jgi:hypothetical protein
LYLELELVRWHNERELEGRASWRFEEGKFRLEENTNWKERDLNLELELGWRGVRKLEGDVYLELWCGELYLVQELARQHDDELESKGNANWRKTRTVSRA